jgi:hypothetical protein
MNPVVFYLAACALFGFSAMLLRRTSPYSRCGGAAYEKRRIRRLVGEILIIAATIVVAVGIIAQLDSY